MRAMRLRSSSSPGSSIIFAAVGAAVISLGVAAPAAHAEVIELLDKTKLNAKIIHFYDGVFTVEVAGQTQKVPREKVRSIGFSLPPARPELPAPDHQFQRDLVRIGVLIGLALRQNMPDDHQQLAGDGN